MKKFRSQCIAAMAVMVISFSPSGLIAETDCPANPKKSATFTFSGVTVAFIAGYRWGEGILKLENGQEFPFTARGLKIGEGGVRGGDIEGEVYGMESLEQFIGHYKGPAGAFIPGLGAGDIQLVNSECVSIVARYTAGGLSISLPTNQKITIQFSGD